ncbi:Myosin-binding protein 2 [Sesamum alatum]|uniref:Myosin-binding protein 2 n=1 Tax=Sesamum alatum TaxID=300844 RepID=A0AAE1Y4Q7_9LAMI|nr:Myosin-binding protein 2 [Sesamum alatum]
MAANRFATMLHRNTNKITLILIYAVLEWVLIVLLLLNSLFSYLIIKFAEFFGLKPPCLWCTRIDHLFDPAKGGKNMHRDLLCEVHAKEVSRLGYCADHQKLVESQGMCEDCLSSRPEFEGLSKDFALFPWVKGFGKIRNDEEKVGENGEVSVSCSCCGVSVENNKYSSYLLLKTSSWDDLECAQKENLVTEAEADDNHHTQEGCVSDEKVFDSAAGLCDDEKFLEEKNENQMLFEFDGNLGETEEETRENGCNAVIVDELKELEGEEDGKVDMVLEEEETLKEENSTVIMKDKSVQVYVEEDAVLEVPPQHLEFFLDYSGNRLVPVELVDSVTEEHKIEENAEVEADDRDEDRAFSPDSEARVEEKEELVVESGRRTEEMDTFLDVDINEEPKYAMLESMEIEEDENSLVFHPRDCGLMTGEFENFQAFPLARWPSQEAGDDQELVGAPREKHSDVHTDNVACEEVAQANNENEADVSIGTEIPDLDITDEIQIQDSVPSYEDIREDPSTSCANLYEADDHGPVQVEEQTVELQSLSVQDKDNTTHNQASFHLELNEIEEDKVPDTPTSVDSLNQLHKKLLLLEKRDSGTEESLDGSVTSELEGGDGVVTVEGLKSALRAERKALQALYAELEEERSASAVAASQTMAMINRLQEEKAAMQMEARQYQRMMEEQSEYDQEALQLLNELMVKREKEKQELEKELESYRKKLLDYETKEKMRLLRKSKDGSSRSGFSSASCSNAEDSDGLSIDLNQEAKEEDGFYSHQEDGNQNTPVEAVVNLEESLADFEEERLSILEQLKVLEEKLLTLDDDKEQHFEDVEGMDIFHEENGNHDGDENVHFNGETNGHANGFPKEMMNGKNYKQRRTAGQKGKSLLPLFDAICDENGDAMLNGNENGFGSNGVHHSYESTFETENKKLAIEEEVDHLYERLQALEADREFLKHCISSLKKGDKGMDLLQEILQHLRDLRNVELRVRNLSDSPII